MVKKRPHMKETGSSSRQNLKWILPGLCLILVVCLTGGSGLQTDPGQIQSFQRQPVQRAVDVPSTDGLKPGANYSEKADCYAYSAQLIRNYMDGVSVNQEKLVFLTFDDGPNQEITPKILDILREERVPATFFVVGKYVTEETRPILKRMITEGHAIGIHSYTHSYQKLYPGGIAARPVILQEVQDSLTAIRRQLGPSFNSKVFRYPGGHMSWRGLAATDQALAKQGIYYMDWNAANGDAVCGDQMPKTAQQAVDFHQRSLKVYPDYNCRVVLMHDAPGKVVTAQALPDIIRYYKTHGYKFGVLK